MLVQKVPALAQLPFVDLDGEPKEHVGLDNRARAGARARFLQFRFCNVENIVQGGLHTTM